MTRSHSEIVVIGGGHNGLVAATYLARAGHEVRVFEARNELGGAVASSEVFEESQLGSPVSRIWFRCCRPRSSMSSDSEWSCVASGQVLHAGRIGWPAHRASGGTSHTRGVPGADRR